VVPVNATREQQGEPAKPGSPSDEREMVVN
jgi:hypothetical protein